jgi:[protein-PII] uridylyltransferase
MASQRHEDKVLRHAEERLVLKEGEKPSRILGKYKNFLKVEQHRLRIWHRSGGSGREIAQGRSQVMDVLLRHVTNAAETHHASNGSGKPVPMCLVAVGGYGRGELCPHSDIDIMFLHGGHNRGGKNDPYVTAVVEEVLYMLWDVGLKLGHSTRTIDDAVAQANADMQSKTALIESRLLYGDKELYEKFRQTLIRRCVKGHETEYITARMADQKERHEKYGGSVYLQEPNVKSGCGGQRDFQNLIWMAFFKYGVLSLAELKKQGFLEAAEQRQLDQAYDFIFRVRNGLHYLTNRATDSIALGMQLKLADEFGYRHHDILRRTEAFMRDYYSHARTIYLLTNVLADRMALNPSEPSRLGALLRRKPQETDLDGFVLCNRVIRARNASVFRDDPLQLMRVFQLAQQHDAELDPDLRALIRNNLQKVDRSFQYDAEGRAMFLSILQRKGQVGRILRMMHEVEFLGKYLPEFGRLTCLVQHEFFHRYTADEHTLQVVECLDRIIDADKPPHGSYRRLLLQLEHAHVLYLSILLHDVGKATNADRHAEASVELARRAAKRLKLGDDHTAQVLFLVRDHLKLSMLSQRRDIDDQATIDAAVRIVKNETNLDMLLLLTFADGFGTSPASWSDWKEALLWELYSRTKQSLGGPERARNILSKRIEQLYKDVTKMLKGKLALEEIYSHFELMPASYYINTSPEEIIGHLQLIHQFIERQLEVETAEQALAPILEWRTLEAQGYSQVVICTWDRLGLFSKICGAFAVANLGILSAHIYTRGDHVVLDDFRVCDDQLNAVTDDKAIRTANGMLERLLTNQETVDFEAMLKRARASRREAPRIREVTIPTIIGFDNEISDTRTIIEVQTENRPGLLYAITNTLSELDIDISFAKIATEKGAAIDSFYIQDYEGNKIVDPNRLEKIKSKLVGSIELLAS